MSRAMSSQQTSRVLSGLLVAVNIVGPLGQILRLLLVQAGPKAFSPGGAVSGCAGPPASERPLVPAAGLPPATAPSYEVFSLVFPSCSRARTPLCCLLPMPVTRLFRFLPSGWSLQAVPALYWGDHNSRTIHGSISLEEWSLACMAVNSRFLPSSGSFQLECTENKAEGKAGEL